jgi:hypothetical protein
MKRLAVVFTVLAVMVLAALAACEGGTFTDPGHSESGLSGSSGGGGGSGGGSVDSDLVAEWYTTQSAANRGDDPYFEIKSDGSFIGNTGFGNDLIKVSTSGGTITATSSGTSVGSADYTIDGNNLNFSDATGIFTALYNGALYTGGYYK